MDTSLIADIVLVALLFLFAVYGLARGFASQLLGFLGGIICFVLAIMLAGQAQVFLQNTFGLTNTISKFYVENLPKVFDNNMLNMTLEELQSYVGSNWGVPQFILKLLVDLLKGGVPNTTLVIDTLAPALAYYTSVVAGFIFIYIVLRILLAIVVKFIGNIAKVPVIGLFDRLLGMALGLVKGLITVLIVLSIINVLPFSFMTDIKIAIENSKITSIFAGIDIFAIITLGLNPIEYVKQYLGM